MKVRLECEIDNGVWAPEEILTKMTDEELIDLFREDITTLVEGMTWTITRGYDERRDGMIKIDPSAPGYPAAGDMIDIQGYPHPHLGDNPGYYIVDKVIEYIPPGRFVDEDGRDIRIFLAGPRDDARFSVAWNGMAIRDHSQIIAHCAHWAERRTA